MTAYIVLAGIPVALWLGLETIARKDRHRRRADARARRRAGFVDMTPPPPGPVDQEHEGWSDATEWRQA